MLTRLRVAVTSTALVAFSAAPVSASTPRLSPPPNYTICTGVVQGNWMLQIACIKHVNGDPVDSGVSFQNGWWQDVDFAGISFFNQERYTSLSNPPVKQWTETADTYEAQLFNQGATVTDTIAWPYTAGTWWSTGFARWIDMNVCCGNGGDYGRGQTDPNNNPNMSHVF